jgi:hypothetical protein
MFELPETSINSPFDNSFSNKIETPDVPSFVVDNPMPTSNGTDKDFWSNPIDRSWDDVEIAPAPAPAAELPSLDLPPVQLPEVATSFPHQEISATNYEAPFEVASYSAPVVETPPAVPQPQYSNNAADSLNFLPPLPTVEQPSLPSLPTFSTPNTFINDSVPNPQIDVQPFKVVEQADVLHVEDEASESTPPESAPPKSIPLWRPKN